MLVWLFVIVAIVVLATLGVLGQFALDDTLMALFTSAWFDGITLLAVVMLFAGFWLLPRCLAYCSICQSLTTKADLTKAILAKANLPKINRIKPTKLGWISKVLSCLPSLFRPVVWLRALCLLAIVLLFVLRAMSAHFDYEQHAVKSRYIVSATALITAISDGVYEPALGSSYRQMAVISDVKPAELSDLPANALAVINPFLDNQSLSINDTDKPSQDNASNKETTANDGSNHHNPPQQHALEGITVLMSANPNFTKTDLSNLKQITPASQVAVKLLITPATQDKSASGFDSNQWLRTRHIHANAQILAMGEVEPLDGNGISQRFLLSLESFRQKLRTHFYQDWLQLDLSQAQAKAVTLSLLTGDRALIDKPTKDLYQLAGISHLLAISGTHVLFLAMILAGLATRIFDRFALAAYQRVPKWQLRMMIMVAASVIYALFTGFDVPAVRTVYMLMAVWVVRYFALPVGTITTLAAVALLMTWQDPYVLWQAGFWLSFIAVLLLVRYALSELDLPMSQANAIAQGRWLVIWRRFCQATKLQFWLFFAMLPLTVLLFGKVPLWGLLVNLFAIELFGLVVVPINLLAGVLFAFSPSLSDALWSISTSILHFLHETLAVGLGTHLGVISAWLYAPFGMVGFMLCFIVLMILLLPKLFSRWLLALPMTALLLVAFRPSDDGLQLIALKSDTPNVMQLLIRQHGQQGVHQWLILSDMGVKRLRANHADVLIDQLHRQGVGRQGLDGIIVQSPSPIFMPLVGQLANELSVHRYWQAGRHESLANIRHEPCDAGKSWQAEGLQIRALTGWRQIDDGEMQHCELEIVSDHLPKFSWQTDDGTDNPNDDLTKISDKSDKSGTQLIISSSRQPKLWQLWAMLCQEDLSIDLPNHFAQTIWLGTTQSADIDDESIAAKLHATQKHYIDD
ncbi:ComEC/Rec2 family competence protein [Moraxella sp. ZJ142]|uniref:ComEC/Rec2 family competence protein n=1 Tax=Moraxella marmotae TaxID=3344520 RepID=UPI0035D4178B